MTVPHSVSADNDNNSLEKDSYLIGAYTEYGSGRCVIYGDEGCFEDTGIDVCGDFDVEDVEMARQFALNIISWLSKGNQGEKILFDTNHRQERYIGFMEFLRKSGYKVHETDRFLDHLSSELLLNYDILVLMSPDYLNLNNYDEYRTEFIYTESEIINITKFVEFGGGLLVVGRADYSERIGMVEEQYNPILVNFGASFKQDVENVKWLKYGYWNCDLVFMYHELTKNVTDLPRRSGVCSLEVDEPVKPLVYLISNDNSNNLPTPESFKTVDGGLVLACAMPGEGRVVCLGMTKPFMIRKVPKPQSENAWRGYYNAQNLTINLATWLGRGGKKILIDQTHHQYEFYPDKKYGYEYEYLNWLEKAGFKIVLNTYNEFEPELSYENLMKFDIVFLIGFRTTLSNTGARWLWSYSENEIENITRYVNSGGGLLIAVNSQDTDLGASCDIYNPIATKFGLKFNNNTIKTNYHNYWDFLKHPIVKNVSYLPPGKGSTVSITGNGTPLASTQATESGFPIPCFSGVSNLILLSMLIMIIVIALLKITGNELLKFKVLTSFGPFYSRLKRNKVLYNRTRERLREHLNVNPGDHFNSIKRTLGIPQGALAYHLRTLEREKYIHSIRSGMFKRFYPIEMDISTTDAKISDSQRAIYDKILRHPGISQSEIVNMVELSMSTVNYHVKSLVDAGLVKLKRKGNVTMCYVTDNVTHNQEQESKNEI